MPDPSSDDSQHSTEPPVKATGEIAREQTVRTAVPKSASETTVKVPAPVAPPEEDTVRTTAPTPPPVPPAGEADEEVEEVEEVEAIEEVEGPGLDVKALVSELEAAAHSVPVPRAEMPTVPEQAAKAAKANPRRDDPPAVVGEVAVVENAPEGLGQPSSSARERPRRKRPIDRSRRDDPPSVAGEVAVASSTSDEPDVSRTPDIVVTSSGSQPVMTSSGSQPVMTSSGSQPVMTSSSPQPMLTASGSHPIFVGPPSSGQQPTMTSSGAHAVMAMGQSGAVPVMGSRVSSDPSGFMVSGAQPRTRSNTPSGGTSGRDSILLWGLAGALVVLALGVVLVMVTLMD